MEQDPGAFQGWGAKQQHSFNPGDVLEAGREAEFILDFGEYCVGQLSFALSVEEKYDAPLWIKISFAEVVSEIAEPFEYQGTLGRGWLQEEIMTIDYPSGIIQLPRRYAFRYVKFQICGGWYRFYLKDIACKTVTSADVKAIAPLPESFSPVLRRIDRISLDTLKNCMQTVFEDGPKRDRRLWLGDFRLQALVNYHSFKNYELCKRCLYLFAGLTDERGVIPSCLFEKPAPHRGQDFILDYTALFMPTLLEYAKASGDLDTAAELWPVAVHQLKTVLEEVDSEGLFHDSKKWWLFIDWQEGLDKQAPEQGVVIFSLKKGIELGQMLNNSDDIAWIKTQAGKMSAAAVKYLFDPVSQLFVSGETRQISWASQAWMTIAGVTPAPVMSNIATVPDAVKPAGPYLYHYVVEAMYVAGMEREAQTLISDYWGKMAKLGADTFWEIFDPENHRLSPYKCHQINSYCHAWSCTPSYFLRA